MMVTYWIKSDSDRYFLEQAALSPLISVVEKEKLLLLKVHFLFTPQQSAVSKGLCKKVSATAARSILSRAVAQLSRTNVAGFE